MKLTNYDTSKKLEELGFKAEHDYCYEKDDDRRGIWSVDSELACWDDYDEECYYPAYDLETIIEALPIFIEKRDIQFDYWLWPDGMGYYKSKDDTLLNVYDGIYEFSNDNTDDNLATTAAKLLIKLIEDKIITLPKDEANKK